MQNEIDRRLDAVEEIVQSEEMYNTIKVSLRAMNKTDLDKLISSVSQTSLLFLSMILLLAFSSSTKVITVDPVHETSNPRDASHHVTTLLTLRAAVRAIPAIRHALDGAGSDLLQTIGSLLNDERLDLIEGLLAKSLNDDAGIGKVCTPLLTLHSVARSYTIPIT